MMFNRRFSLLIKVICFFITLLLVRNAYATDQWIFLGDSLTVGMIGDGSQLEREVRTRWSQNIKVINTSRRGKHSYEYKREIHQILAQYPRV